jgi:hypothetical protein
MRFRDARDQIIVYCDRTTESALAIEDTNVLEEK